jgi:hypothetical protein
MVLYKTAADSQAFPAAVLPVSGFVRISEGEAFGMQGAADNAESLRPHPMQFQELGLGDPTELIQGGVPCSNKRSRCWLADPGWKIVLRLVT